MQLAHNAQIAISPIDVGFAMIHNSHYQTYTQVDYDWAIWAGRVEPKRRAPRAGSSEAEEAAEIVTTPPRRAAAVPYA